MNIQSQLKAPKNQRNTFGNYNYRSCEDILEALKPLLKENNLTLTITDTIENMGERYYIKAVVKLTDIESGESEVVSALAREEENKKGMDSMQLTGATSSYARKYALNGMFCIDDTKDADSLNEHDKPQGNSAGQGKQNPPPTTPPNGSDAVKMSANAIMEFGKHKGKTLGAIFKEHPDYVTWFLEKGTDPGIKTAFQILQRAVEEAKQSAQSA